MRQTQRITAISGSLEKENVRERETDFVDFSVTLFGSISQDSRK